MKTWRCQLRNAIHSNVLDVLRRARRQNQEWFDDNNVTYLPRRTDYTEVYIDRLTDANRAASFRCRRLVQQWLREMRNVWMDRRTEEINGYADCNATNNFSPFTKEACGSRIKRIVLPLSSGETTFLTEKPRMPEPWAERFRIGFNQQTTIFDAVTDKLLSGGNE
ncbi:hypothetical protein SprV_0401570600 [Sparganum proliferum]